MADVLKRKHVHALANSETALTVASSHTYTILSFSLCEQDGDADVVFKCYVGPTGGQAIYLYNDQSLPAKSTFVHNDKIVLEADDKIAWVIGSSGNNVDVIISYLDQN